MYIWKNQRKNWALIIMVTERKYLRQYFYTWKKDFSLCYKLKENFKTMIFWKSFIYEKSLKSNLVPKKTSKIIFLCFKLKIFSVLLENLFFHLIVINFSLYFWKLFLWNFVLILFKFEKLQNGCILYLYYIIYICKKI